jgi:hypothetical protein
MKYHELVSVSVFIEKICPQGGKFKGGFIYEKVVSGYVDNSGRHDGVFIHRHPNDAYRG